MNTTTSVFDVCAEEVSNNEHVTSVRVILRKDNRIHDVFQATTLHRALQPLIARSDGVSIGVRCADGIIQYPECLSLEEALQAAYPLVRGPKQNERP